MSEYEVTIAEPVAPDAGAHGAGPTVRTVDWRGEAESEQAATEAAWRAWDEQYGSERERPAHAEVRVNEVNE
jgi:hypothetical protein